MKSTIILFIALVFSLSVYAQPTQKKINTTVNPTTKTPAGTTNVPKTAQSNVPPNTQSEQKMPAHPIKQMKAVQVPPDMKDASLLDAFFTLQTAEGEVGVFGVSGEGKDGDTHWSCGLFDQHEKPITSFHDDSDTDPYELGTSTGPLKMHLDATALFNDFANGGKLHINIAPNGNDTWQISQFTLTLDFLNPKITKQITWKNIKLTQDQRDVDLYFIYDGNNFVVRQ